MTWFTFLSFIRHRLTAKRWNAFHSPYLFRLFSHACNDRIRFEKFDAIETLRRKWLRNRSQIERTDFGSGSVFKLNQKKQSISSIARHALSLPFQCRFMARMVQQEKPGVIVEFGTSLGISAAYLMAGNPNAEITTIEGDPEIAKIARSTFTSLDMPGIQLMVTTFESYLNSLDKKEKRLDMLFIDGNHQSKALLAYYEGLKRNFSSNTILIVDDLYWSKDMQEGWTKLLAKPEVTQSVDCFQFGLLFFRDEFLEKEHHVVRLPLRSIWK